MINNKKSISKLFGPVLLLTGALALPADLATAAPAKPGIARPDKDNKQHGKRPNRQAQVRAEKQRVAQQKQAVHQREVRQKQVQKQQVRQQAQIQRQQAELQRQSQRQAAAQRQLNLQRQAEARRQAQLRAGRQRTVVVVPPRTRTRFVARPYVYRTSPYYRNGYYYVPPVPARAQRDRSVIAADGFLDASRDCLILRGHEGQVYSLVGDTSGLWEGDHVRVLGRLTYDRYCGATALDVSQVQAVWADRNHRQVYYDHLSDGSFDRYEDRGHDDRYDDDDRYYDNRY